MDNTKDGRVTACQSAPSERETDNVGDPLQPTFYVESVLDLICSDIKYAIVLYAVILFKTCFTFVSVVLNNILVQFKPVIRGLQ